MIEKFLDEFPKTRIVRTPNDGIHIYYKVDREIRCKVNLYEGIDIRGDGGYVVGVGSVINGKEYKIDGGAVLLKLMKQFIASWKVDIN